MPAGRTATPETEGIHGRSSDGDPSAGGDDLGGGARPGPGAHGGRPPGRSGRGTRPPSPARRGRGDRRGDGAVGSRSAPRARNSGAAPAAASVHGGPVRGRVPRNDFDRGRDGDGRPPGPRAG